jgi:hypothetical protein
MTGNSDTANTGSDASNGRAEHVTYNPESFYIYFESHVHDEGDSVAQVSKEVFEKIKPWESQLIAGNHSEIPLDAYRLLWGDNGEGIAEKADRDLRDSELHAFSNPSNTVTVAIC